MTPIGGPKLAKQCSFIYSFKLKKGNDPSIFYAVEIVRIIEVGIWLGFYLGQEILKLILTKRRCVEVPVILTNTLLEEMKANRYALFRVCCWQSIRP